MKKNLSFTVITYNEEKNIADCLESVKWADEIIVVDSFSTDRTAEIAKTYTGKVYQVQWQGHVKQKQFALDQATGNWVLCLDADERLSVEAAEEIRKIIEDMGTETAGFTFPRQSFYLGKWIGFCGWYPDRKLRLVRNGKAKWAGEDPHDKLIVSGKTESLRGRILHYVYRNISHQLSTVDSFSRISAEQWLKKGKKPSLFLMIIKPPARFLEVYLWKQGFRDGMAGFIISVITSYYTFLKYAKLWELKKGLSKPTPL